MDLTWPKIVLLAFFALAALASVTQVGKVRRPLSGGSVAVSMIIQGFLCWLVIIA